jgi:hypothetical protein
MLDMLLVLFALATPSGQSPLPKQAQMGHADAFTRPLSFTTNGTFQVSIFEDLHFGESEFHASTRHSA